MSGSELNEAEVIQKWKEHERLENESKMAKKFADDLLSVAKKTYRKHVCNDDSIGWDELGTELCNVLCNVMGDKEFQRTLSS